MTCGLLLHENCVNLQTVPQLPLLEENFQQLWAMEQWKLVNLVIRGTFVYPHKLYLYVAMHLISDKKSKIYMCLHPQNIQWQKHCDQRHAEEQNPTQRHWPHHQLLCAGRRYRQSGGFHPHRRQEKQCKGKHTSAPTIFHVYLRKVVPTVPKST